MDNQNQQKKIILNLLSNIVNGQNIKEAEAKIKEYESQPGEYYPCAKDFDNNRM